MLVGDLSHSPWCPHHVPSFLRTQWTVICIDTCNSIQQAHVGKHPCKKEGQKNTISVPQCSDNSYYVVRSTTRFCRQKMNDYKSFSFFFQISLSQNLLTRKWRDFNCPVLEEGLEEGCNRRSLLRANGCIWETWTILMSGHFYHGDEISEIIEFITEHTCVIQ